MVLLFANWFGDSLDGTVARFRRLERPRYGYYVDHVIDMAGASMLLLGLASSGLMAPTLAVALLASFLLVSSEAFLAVHAAGVLRLSFAELGPTELRIALATATLRAASSPFVTIAGRDVRFFDLAGAVGTLGLAVAFVGSAVKNASALYTAEPVDRERPSRAARIA